MKSKFLVKFEEAIINNSLNDLWFEDNDLGECWESRECSKKSCPSYGKKNIRCWHVLKTKCIPEMNTYTIQEKLKICKECSYYNSYIKDDNLFRETINNIIYMLKNYDSSTLDSLEKRNEVLSYITDKNLTTREVEILFLYLKRFTRSQIAKKLAISIETVKMHIKKVYSKLNVHSKNELFALLSIEDVHVSN
jgi:DNA-binding CsgD family transcriptional regulator